VEDVLLIHLLLWPIAAFVVVVGAYTAGRYAGNVRALPTIATALTGGEPEFSAEIDERIRNLFPIGSEESRLIEYLATEGFTPEWQRVGEPKAAVFTHLGLLCEKRVRIVWRADERGTLTDIGGGYASHCL
jgi:hypothetical protein